MAGKTKERILEAALVLFSNKGYEGTNLQEIANSVGIVKSALYRHFESKEEIWKTILDKMNAYYYERFGSKNNLPKIPDNAGEFKNLVLQMLDFTINDDNIIRTRKLLLTEQFRDKRVRTLATEHFNVALESLFANIFAGMSEKGLMKTDDPQMLAFAFSAPVSSLVHLCDREPEKKQEAMEKAKAFIEHFTKTYMA